MFAFNYVAIQQTVITKKTKNISNLTRFSFYDCSNNDKNKQQ